MNFSDDQENDLVVDMTPMIDCVFLLLIFFLVATVVKKTEEEIDVNLPQAKFTSEKKYSDETLPLVIGIDKSGQFYIDGSPVGKQRLHLALKEVAQSDPKRRIRIDGDRDARFQDLASIMELCSFEGLTNVGIHTEQKAVQKK